MHFHYNKAAKPGSIKRHLYLFSKVPKSIWDKAVHLLQHSENPQLFAITLPKNVQHHFFSPMNDSGVYLSFSEDVENWYESQKGSPIFNSESLKIYDEEIRALIKNEEIENKLSKKEHENIIEHHRIDKEKVESTKNEDGNIQISNKKVQKPLKLEELKLQGRWTDLKDPVQINDIFSINNDNDLFSNEENNNIALSQNSSSIIKYFLSIQSTERKLKLDWNKFFEMTGISKDKFYNFLSISLGIERFKSIDQFNEIELVEIKATDQLEWYRESHLEYGSTIVIFNINGDIFIELLSEYGGKQKSIFMKSNSCLILDGNLRWAWKRKIIVKDSLQESHYGLILRHKRLSPTEEQLNSDPKNACECTFDETICEIKKKIHDERLSKMTPQELEDLYVRDVYDAIAEHWDSTRYSPWKPTVDFLETLPEGSYVGDIGCGNGRNMIINRKLKMKGCDISSRLVEICKNKGLDVVVGDAKNTPFNDEEFDHVISVAVLHHFSTEESRLQAMKELYRIVKPNGLIFLYAWAFEQDETSRREFDTKTQDVMVPWNLQKKFIEMREINLKSDEEVSQRIHNAFATETYSENESIKAPLKKKSDETNKTDNIDKKIPERIVYQRYCYLFKKGELETLWFKLFDNSQIEIKEANYDCGNWFTIVKKLQ